MPSKVERALHEYLEEKRCFDNIDERTVDSLQVEIEKLSKAGFDLENKNNFIPYVPIPKPEVITLCEGRQLTIVWPFISERGVVVPSLFDCNNEMLFPNNNKELSRLLACATAYYYHGDGIKAIKKKLKQAQKWCVDAVLQCKLASIRILDDEQEYVKAVESELALAVLRNPRYSLQGCIEPVGLQTMRMAIWRKTAYNAMKATLKSLGETCERLRELGLTPEHDWLKDWPYVRVGLTNEKFSYKYTNFSGITKSVLVQTGYRPSAVWQLIQKFKEVHRACLECLTAATPGK